MRGTKETLGGMKEGTKSKGRTAARSTTGKSVKAASKTKGHAGSGHSGMAGGRKSSSRTGGTK